MLQPIEYLKGVGQVRGELLRKELNLHTWGDLLEHFPLRHIDKTRIEKIAALTPAQDFAQVTGVLQHVELIGKTRGRRLVAKVADDTGVLELVWFQGINWVQKILIPGQRYRIFGRLGFFMNRPQMAHPEMEPLVSGASPVKEVLDPVYPVTEKLKARGVYAKTLAESSADLFRHLQPSDIPEFLPEELLKKYRLLPRFEAYRQMHFPASQKHFEAAVRRLKFDELFLAHMRLSLVKVNRHNNSSGWRFDKVGDLFNAFYKNHLPFKLTNAQKRVMKEIRHDTASGRQMNRLLQGDVGSGKTIVALLCMLLAADNGFQSVMMAPTEILARQHYISLTELLGDLPVQIRLLTGSTKAKERRPILEGCAAGEVQILVGTHAVIEDAVQFKNLGFAVVDEQHKFGVAQRAQLWQKNTIAPHILVMTATPIPRTLALTAYGDLDYSVMDELPPGRKPVITVHRRDHERMKVMQFVEEQLIMGRQAYVIYPLIEESSKLDYENLMRGYEEVKTYFPEHRYRISVLHGRQPSEQKDINMQRFVTHNTHIMVSTTVIEVGVNVPNATVMVIESAEKFGLSQLHQLRGRVGRGGEQSYCILMTGEKISRDAIERMKIMVETNDGFRVAEKDLELRGPGDIEGTRQSGLLNFKLANLVNDKAMLEVIRVEVAKILGEDPGLFLQSNAALKNVLEIRFGKTAWSKIS